jgi:hypothetical protein
MTAFCIISNISMQRYKIYFNKQKKNQTLQKNSSPDIKKPAERLFPAAVFYLPNALNTTEREAYRG